jgi:ribose-phosphate pyrophosphokinase
LQPLLLHFDEHAAATALARAAGFPAAPIERHRFPDGELRLRLPPALPRRVILHRSLHQPDEKLVELLIAARAARELGATELVLVAPYLAYMRQDMAFKPGEAVSQRIVGGFLAGLFDAVITVDPHLHRIARLSDAVPARAAVAVSAAPAIGAFLAERGSDWLLLGPDAESAQWVAQAAAAGGFEHAVCAKERHGDREVAISLPARPLQGRRVAIVDDIASTARTVAAAARLARAAGATEVVVAVTHALYAGDALAHLQAAGVDEVWSSDSVPHASNRIPLAPLLADALAALSLR